MTNFKLLSSQVSSFILPAICALFASLLMVNVMTATAHAETAWVGDLPVPADSLIDQNSAVNFDAPSGRVVKFTFQTSQDAIAIDVFYETRLTALGWQPSATGYARGSEQIQIITDGKSDDGHYRYQVTVGPAN